MGGLLSKSETMVSEDVRIFCDTTISTVKVVVFSKTFCPYCRKAKSILAQYPIDPKRMEVLELEKRPDCQEIQAYMKTLTGASSVPRVFINGQCIGGGDDTAKLHETGQLQELLRECGAIQ
jgi:glutaredoxin 3